MANHSDVQRPMKVAISRPSRLERAVQLEQPARRVVREVGEDRDRIDEIEAPMLQCQRRDRDRLPGVKRRTQVALQPLDARPVDVAAPELRGLGLPRRSGAASARPPNRSRVSACPRRTTGREAAPRSGARSAHRAPDSRRPASLPPFTAYTREASAGGGSGRSADLADMRGESASQTQARTSAVRGHSGVSRDRAVTAQRPRSERPQLRARPRRRRPGAG